MMEQCLTHSVNPPITPAILHQQVLYLQNYVLYSAICHWYYHNYVIVEAYTSIQESYTVYLYGILVLLIIHHFH